VAADGVKEGFACGIVRKRGVIPALEDEEFGAGDASCKGLSLFERLDGVAPCVDHQRRGADGRQQGADVKGVNRAAQARRGGGTGGGDLHRGEAVYLLAGGVGHVEGGEGLDEGAAVLAPAGLDQRGERVAFGRLGPAARETAEGEPTIEQERGHPLGPAHGEADRDGHALRGGEDGEAVEAGGVGHRLEVVGHCLKVEAGDIALGEAGAALIEAGDGEGRSQGVKKRPPDRAQPVEFEMRQPMAGAQERQARAGRGESDGGAVAGTGVPYSLVGRSGRVAAGGRVIAVTGQTRRMPRRGTVRMID
jgi:hypothetical protein